MLQPSENFTADQIRFLQTEAKEWIEKVNKMIIEAASKGDAFIHVTLSKGMGHMTEFYSGYYKAPEALQAHFKQRGFNVSPNGQTSIIIDWKIEIAGEVHRCFDRVNSSDNIMEGKPNA